MPDPAPKMDQDGIASALKDLPEWSEVGEAIQRTYQFPDFMSAMAFVAKVAEHAERAQHHPDIMIRYNKVTLTYSTHDSGGITAKDFDAARHVDEAAGPPVPQVPAAAKVVKKKK